MPELEAGALTYNIREITKLDRSYRMPVDVVRMTLPGEPKLNVNRQNS